MNLLLQNKSEETCCVTAMGEDGCFLLATERNRAALQALRKGVSWMKLDLMMNGFEGRINRNITG